MGTSSATHQLSSSRKRLRFATIQYSDIHLIPTRHEMTMMERSATWYQRGEIATFRSRARNICRVLIEQMTPKKNQTNNGNLRLSSPLTAKNHLGGPKENCQSLESKKVTMKEQDEKSIIPHKTKASSPCREEFRPLDPSDLFPRGFEHLLSYERRVRKRVAIHAILKVQAKNREDALGISLVSQKFTSWALSRAYLAGRHDAGVAADAYL